MRQGGGGQIVNISSQASTKAALNNLSLTAREELAKDAITVSIVKPGIVDTDFGKNTPSPEPDALRHGPDGTLLPHVLAPSAVAAVAAVDVAEAIRSGDAELDLVGGQAD